MARYGSEDETANESSQIHTAKQNYFLVLHFGTKLAAVSLDRTDDKQHRSFVVQYVQIGP